MLEWLPSIGRRADDAERGRPAMFRLTQSFARNPPHASLTQEHENEREESEQRHDRRDDRGSGPYWASSLRTSPRCCTVASISAPIPRPMSTKAKLRGPSTPCATSGWR